jgi:hypothetical protein
MKKIGSVASSISLKQEFIIDIFYKNVAGSRIQEIDLLDKTLPGPCPAAAAHI